MANKKKDFFLAYNTSYVLVLIHIAFFFQVNILSSKA